jgi:ubiquinone/menaquinone biosynthesis C-methylase UbiE
MPEATPAKSDEVDEVDYRRSHMESGDHYDAVLAAAPFDAYMADLEARFLRRAVPALFPSAPPRHLDFACGTGRVTEVVAPLCAQTVGVDVSSTMLEQARRKCPAVRFVQADLTQGDAGLGSFDLATAFRFFGNAQDELRRDVLQALHRALRPEGVLILDSHRNPHSLAALMHAATGGRQEMDLHYFKLRRLLRRHGFEIRQVLPIGVWLYRSKLLNTVHDDARAQRWERRFAAPVYAPIAPDVVVVAAKSAAAGRPSSP